MRAWRRLVDVVRSNQLELVNKMGWIRLASKANTTSRSKLLASAVAAINTAQEVELL